MRYRKHIELFRVVNHKYDYRQNRPFPSSKKFHFQNEAKSETFVVEMNFICIIIKTHFHNKGFALSLVLKVKRFGTRKWPIGRHEDLMGFKNTFLVPNIQN